MPVAPFREAFERKGETAAAIARRLGWRDHRGEWDGKRVRRALGILPYTIGGIKSIDPKRVTHRTHVTVEVAQRLVEALGVDPWEVGL